MPGLSLLVASSHHFQMPLNSLYCQPAFLKSRKKITSSFTFLCCPDPSLFIMMINLNFVDVKESVLLKKKN